MTLYWPLESKCARGTTVCGVEICRLTGPRITGSVGTATAASSCGLKCSTATGIRSCSSKSVERTSGCRWKRRCMRSIAQEIGQRGHDHSLVVRHVAEHDDAAFALRHALGRVVDRVVETPRSFGALGSQVLEVPDGRGRVESAAPARLNTAKSQGLCPGRASDPSPGTPNDW